MSDELATTRRPMTEPAVWLAGALLAVTLAMMLWDRLDG
jgi:hypothetical protein